VEIAPKVPDHDGESRAALTTADVLAERSEFADLGMGS
jgi:hypothetical protein